MRTRPASTLIEILLYTALVGMTLTAVVNFSSSMLRGRAKASTSLDVEQNARFALLKMGTKIRSAAAAVTPVVNTTSTSLVLTMPTGVTSPVTYQVTGGVLTEQIGVAAAVPLTSGTVRVTGLTFQNLRDPSITEVTSGAVACAPKITKRLICHGGNTQCINLTAVPAHIAQGDTLGPCEPFTTAKAAVRITLTVATLATGAAQEYQTNITLYDTENIREQQ